jgi:hypothetical protein
MTATITWTISTCDRDVATGFITTAHWSCNGVDGDFTGSVYATCSWAVGAPSIPYANVTEAQVLAWVWESVDKDATEAAVAAQIEAQKNPVTASGTPW